MIIASQGEDVGDAARAIYLRSDPEPANKKDDSIYRYDRAGLLLALKSAGRGDRQMNELLLVVTIAGEKVALPAAAVKRWLSSTR